jgi:uncharacterized protein YbgA (DUF1722 family)/uncharacterized protein YbbK (DUF523 family)
MESTKPKVVVSKCLGFAACRYDGGIISSDFVSLLRPYVEFLPVCPEVEMGLPVPREPIRIVREGSSARLLQPATGKDFTGRMKEFTASFLGTLGPVDGFLLKSRSPSCGTRDVKSYTAVHMGRPASKGAGMFGGAVLAGCPDIATEDEGRVTNQRLREHFLTRVFMSASFRRVRAKGKMKHLVQFHSENKLLLMAYSQRALKVLGRIVANPERLPVASVFAAYETHLPEAFTRVARSTSCINVLMHAMGYFSNDLSGKEKRFLLDTFEEFRKERVPLSVPVNILRAHIIRFEEPYLMQQTFFEPFPEDLLTLKDSGKGRGM